ncbi:MAG: transposase [Xanthomonadaceae bacterium]|nr:transposase [Xanthomonadaceae bacterium]
MARPIRLESAGAQYHVTAQCGRREEINVDDANRERFLSLLGEVVAAFNWRCHAYCLMSNHYPLVLETPVGALRTGASGLP